MCVYLSQLPEIRMFGLVEVELFLLNTKLQVCLIYIHILMSNQTARTMATSHLDTNVTVNITVRTKLCVDFALGTLSVAIPALIRHEVWVLINI